MGTTYNLTNPEIRHFHKLRSTCNTSVDPKNPDHRVKLTGLQKLLWALKNLQDDLPNFDQHKAPEKTPAIQTFKSEHWKSFGFQSQFPCTDFRGGGTFSLNNLIFFAEERGESVEEMTRPENGFLFAVSSINISYFLKVYFHLADFLEYSKDRAVFSKRRGFKNFCGFLAKDPDLMHELHHFLLEELFRNWIHIKEEFNANIIQFGVALDHVKDTFKKIWNARSYVTIKEFYTRYEKKKRAISSMPPMFLPSS